MPTFMGRQGTTAGASPATPACGIPSTWSRSLTRSKLSLGFLAADDGQVDPDLDRQRLAVDGDRDLAVVVPAERSGRELALVGDQLGAADEDLHRLRFIEKLRLGNRAR